MNIYDRDLQVNNIQAKIGVALERLAVVQKHQLQQIAKVNQLTPLQMQLLIFINQHQQELNNTSLLAKEFAVTKPTISDALNSLIEKQLIIKKVNLEDGRAFHFMVSLVGKNKAQKCEMKMSNSLTVLEKYSSKNKLTLWKQLSDLLASMSSHGLIPMRMCQTCCHFKEGDANKESFCQLLNVPLPLNDLRVDCPEYVNAL